MEFCRGWEPGWVRSDQRCEQPHEFVHGYCGSELCLNLDDQQRSMYSECSQYHHQLPEDAHGIQCGNRPELLWDLGNACGEQSDRGGHGGVEFCPWGKPGWLAVDR